MKQTPALLKKTEFSEYIIEHLEKPFKWGENDCVLFAIGWLNKKTGRDWLKPYGKWGSQTGAIRAIKRAGSLEEQFNKHLKSIDPNFAKDGAITILKRNNLNYEFCGLFSGRHVIAVGKDGLMFFDRMEATCAWDYS